MWKIAISFISTWDHILYLDLEWTASISFWFRPRWFVVSIFEGYHKQAYQWSKERFLPIVWGLARLFVVASDLISHLEHPDIFCEKSFEDREKEEVEWKWKCLLCSKYSCSYELCLSYQTNASLAYLLEPPHVALHWPKPPKRAEF